MVVHFKATSRADNRHTTLWQTVPNDISITSKYIYQTHTYGDVWHAWPRTSPWRRILWWNTAPVCRLHIEQLITVPGHCHSPPENSSRTPLCITSIRRRVYTYWSSLSICLTRHYRLHLQQFRSHPKEALVPTGESVRFTKLHCVCAIVPLQLKHEGWEGYNDNIFKGLPSKYLLWTSQTHYEHISYFACHHSPNTKYFEMTYIMVFYLS